MPAMPPLQGAIKPASVAAAVQGAVEVILKISLRSATRRPAWSPSPPRYHQIACEYKSTPHTTLCFDGFPAQTEREAGSPFAVLVLSIAGLSSSLDTSTMELLVST